MYLPGSYLVYPSPIHLHHLPLPSTLPTPKQSQSSEDPSSTIPSFGLKNSLSTAFCDLLPTMEDSGSTRSPGPTAMESESGTTHFESTVHQQPSSSSMAISLPTQCRRSTPPALQSPPICRRSPPTVASRDLKFGVDRILSGELSLPRRPPSRKDTSAREEISQVVRESSCNSNESTIRPNRIDSSPSSRILSSPSPPSSAPSSPVLTPNCPAVVTPCPRNALLLRCNGDYFGQSMSSFPAPYPSTAASTRHPPPPHLDHTPLGCTTPGTSSYAAAYSGYYQQLHHHQGIISYTSLYAPGGSLLAPHLDEVGGPRCSSIGGACVPVVPSSGSGGSGVSGGGTSGGKRKRSWSRAVFSNLQRKGLEKRFQLQKYITKPDRRQLAATLGLTDAQVKVWFQNRRMKWRHSKEGKQTESPNSNIQAASSLQISHEEDKTSSHSTPVGETTVDTEWNDSGRNSNGMDSVVKGMEEEIRVDS